MRLAAQQRSNLENTQFLGDPEWNGLVNLGAQELWDLLVATSEDYFVGAPFVPTLVSGTSLYALPSDFFKALQVDVVQSDAYRYSIPRLMPAERNFYQIGSGCAGYRIIGSNIQFIPSIPTSGGVEVLYAPQFSRLKNDTDTLNVAIPEGWDEYCVLYAAMRAKVKQRVDASDIQGLLGDMRQRIQSMAPSRDTNEQARVTDVNNRFGRDRWYFDVPYGRGT